MTVQLTYETSIILEGETLEEIMNKYDDFIPYTSEQEDEYFAEFRGITKAVEIKDGPEYKCIDIREKIAEEFAY